jgi:hypothetical protein
VASSPGGPKALSVSIVVLTAAVAIYVLCMAWTIATRPEACSRLTVGVSDKGVSASTEVDNHC